MWLDYELARTGRREQAAADLRSILAKSNGAPVPDYFLAAAWTAVGNKQEALEALNRAFRARSNWIIYLQYDPHFDTLRSDPQFQSLIQKVSSHQT